MVDFSKTTQVQKDRLKLLENRKWFEDHLDELIKDHAGKYALISNCQIVGLFETMDELYDAIGKKKISQDEALIQLVPLEPIEIIE